MQKEKKLKIDGREIDPKKICQPSYANNNIDLVRLDGKDLKEIFHELMLEDYRRKMEHDAKVLNKVFEK